jgi:aldose 1-epimerase
MVTSDVKQKGIEIQLFHLNNGDIEVGLCNYGCTIVSVSMPGRNGEKKNVVAGFSNPKDYQKDHPYFGSTVGRFANRVAGGKFTIDEQVYHLRQNNNGNHLHGGINAFHRKVWVAVQDERGIAFSYLSEDGEEGYPGNLQVSVQFSLSDDNELRIEYKATTDRVTIINLTNHSYFNLSGFETPTILDQQLKIYSGTYTAKNENNVPSGEIRPVRGTPYDFTNSRLIGKDINLLQADRGYDINYVLDNASKEPAPAAELYDPRSGRLLKVFTDQPGLQVYTANWWDGSFVDQQGKPYLQHGAVALETQAFPDSPNHRDFPNTILRPGEVYHTTTTYQFLTA